MLRRFRLWHYGVGHSRMLIRSPKDKVHSENVDIAFTAVFYIEIAPAATGFLMNLDSLEDIRPDDKDLKYLEEKLGVKQSETHQYYIFRTDSTKFYIGAAKATISYNELDYVAVES